MNMDERVKRINELYHKSQGVGLTDAEKAEQTALRKEYIAAIRGSLRNSLNNIDIQEKDGSITNLGEKYGKKESESESKESAKDKAETPKEKQRSEYKKIRNRIGEQKRKADSFMICKRIEALKAFKESKNILLYSPFGSEADINELFDIAIRAGKNVFFPKCELVDGKNDMIFYRIDSQDKLETGYMGISEPDIHNHHLEKLDGNPDLIIVPLLVFDEDMNRMGYGKGFYDRFLLENDCKTSIGVAFDEQKSDKVICDDNDVKLNMIVTPSKLYGADEDETDEAERQNRYIESLKEVLGEKKQRLGRDVTYCVTTFGCQMNARDSEKLKGILEVAGAVELEDENKADIVIFNTCTVRDNADQRLYGRLGSLVNIKKKNPEKIIGICGCLMQESQARDKILSSYPYVDLIFGTHNVFAFAELMLRTLLRSPNEKGKYKAIIDIWDDTSQIVEDLPKKRNYSFKSGVNIMFGCNNFCSYCIVPYVRGREKSRKSCDILAEVKKLAEDGVVEVMLLGQNVNSYAKDDKDEVSFARLLDMVANVEGIKRVRFMTSHPKDLSDELIEVIKNNPKIARHIHLPLQSGSTRILTSMNRRYTKEQYIDLALRIRKEIPDIAITTDIIIGYPTETKEDVDDTIDVINKVSFDGAFTFIYSKRCGTPAAKMEGQVDEKFAKESFDRVLECVQATSVKQAMMNEGKVMEVLVEEINRQDPSLVSGRLSNNMVVHFTGDESLIGKIVKVRLNECKGFYYIGGIEDGNL